MFSISFPTSKKSIQSGGTFKTLYMASGSIDFCKEWILTLNIIQSFEGKMSKRKSILQDQ